MLIIFIRAIILYLLIIFTMRILGKRQLGELEASEFAITILISDLASVPMQDTGIPLLHGLIPILVVVSIEFIISFGIVRSLRFRKFMCGKPSIIVQNGEINQREMRKNRFSIDELMEELRAKNITDISKIKYAILETGGELNTILYGKEQPLTVSQMKIKTEDKGIPIALVSDGRMIEENMAIRNVDKKWLEDYLHRHKQPGYKDIFLMTMDDCQNIYIQKKEKKG